MPEMENPYLARLGFMSAMTVATQLEMGNRMVTGAAVESSL